MAVRTLVTNSVSTSFQALKHIDTYNLSYNVHMEVSIFMGYPQSSSIFYGIFLKNIIQRAIKGYPHFQAGNPHIGPSCSIMRWHEQNPSEVRYCGAGEAHARRLSQPLSLSGDAALSWLGKRWGFHEMGYPKMDGL